MDADGIVVSLRLKQIVPDEMQFNTSTMYYAWHDFFTGINLLLSLIFLLIIVPWQRQQVLLFIDAITHELHIVLSVCQ